MLCLHEKLVKIINMEREVLEKRPERLTSEELLSKTIDFLRFPLAVLVVYLHFNFATKGITIRGEKYGLNNPEWYYWTFDFIAGVIAKVCVPMFFVISGFLFFYRRDFTLSVYKQKMKSRMRTLLIPFFLWNSIAILFEAMMLLPVFTSIAPKNSQVEMHFSLMRIFHTFFTDYYNEGIFVKTAELTSSDATLTPFPIDVSLWYVRDLLLMVLISPAIHWMVKKAGKWFVILTGILWYTCLAKYHVEGGWSTQLVTALFFFSWGAYFSINKLNFVTIMMKYRYVLLPYILIAIGDVATKGGPWNFLIHHLGIVLGIIAFVSVGASFIASGKAKVYPTLAKSSFFIFACHAIFMGLFGKCLFYLLGVPDNPWAMLMFYLIVPLLTTGICLSIYLLLRKFTPKFILYLSAGR